MTTLDDETCSICCSNIEERVGTGTCSHVFCKSCLLRWCRSRIAEAQDALFPSCPVCRYPVLCVFQVADLSRPCPKPHPDVSVPVTRTVRVSHPCGITLTSSGSRLFVSSVVANDGAALGGIKLGDEVCAINDLIVFDHAPSVRLIEYFGRMDGSVRLCISSQQDAQRGRDVSPSEDS